MMDTCETNLSSRMRQLADTGHERAEELREKAKAFDDATAGFYGDPQTVDARKFLGCFARARRLWCDITGESLI
jgi:hypothetical protein